MAERFMYADPIVDSRPVRVGRIGRKLDKYTVHQARIRVAGTPVTVIGKVRK